jgi:hypothetical protein
MTKNVFSSLLDSNMINMMKTMASEDEINVKPIPNSKIQFEDDF